MKNAYFIPNVQYRAPKKVDPLRVSQSISKNMMKDLNKDAYATGNKNDTDIKLANKDTEIQFGQEEEGEVKEKEPKIDLHTIDKNEVVDIRENETDKNTKILNEKNKTT